MRSLLLVPLLVCLLATTAVVQVQGADVVKEAACLNQCKTLQKSCLPACSGSNTANGLPPCTAQCAVNHNLCKRDCPAHNAWGLDMISPAQSEELGSYTTACKSEHKACDQKCASSASSCKNACAAQLGVCMNGARYKLLYSAKPMPAQAMPATSVQNIMKNDATCHKDCVQKLTQCATPCKATSPTCVPTCKVSYNACGASCVEQCRDICAVDSQSCDTMKCGNGSKACKDKCLKQGFECIDRCVSFSTL